MYAIRYVVPLVLGLAYLQSSALRAAVPTENLDACKLPHGQVLLPIVGAPEAEHGELFKLSDGTFTSLPARDADNRLLTRDQSIIRARSAKSADVEFMPDDKGTLWALSGRISELGPRYLFEAAAMKFDAPLEMPGNPTGMYPQVVEGRTYLIQCMDKHYALVRIIELSPAGATIQYVYQPSGALTFDIPRGEILISSPASQPATTLSVPPLAATAPAATEPLIRTSIGIPPPIPIATTVPSFTPPAASLPASPPRFVLGPGERVDSQHLVLRGDSVPPPTASPSGTSPGTLDPAVETVRTQREQLIKSRQAILEAPARTPAEIDRKVQAINELIALHADEAANTLVDQITFLNTRSASREFSVDALHPCLAALKHLGSPASKAALAALRQLDMDAPGDGIDSPQYKAGLLGTVIRATEGNDVGDFILRKELDKQTDPKHRAVFEFLLNTPKN